MRQRAQLRQSAGSANGGGDGDSPSYGVAAGAEAAGGGSSLITETLLPRLAGGWKMHLGT